MKRFLATMPNMITNLVVLLTVNLFTNTTFSFHPSGIEKIQIDTVIEQQVLQYVWRGNTNFLTNEIVFAEYRKKLVMNWIEVPLKVNEPPYYLPLTR